ncbi:MAG TPA: YhjD/YihY/BrkB family envelope integrity protein [Desulfomicrobiaceae bacterium]|nr:YhjD/YihY/BrkB family envelope integrity protein [Desulfomicrobiaceae bacterium]
MPRTFSVGEKIRALLWPGSSSPLPARILRPSRTLFVLVRDLLDEDLTLRAMSLVYTTLLSLVPLLALSFSVLKGFGVHNQLEPMLLNLLAPLGPKGAELTERLLAFVDNVKVGVLGSVGLAFLFLTVISLIQKIERAFNSIWHIPASRGVARRFSDYLSVVLVGPVLAFAALSVTGSVLGSSLTHTLLQKTGSLFLLNWAGRLVPLALLSTIFSFLYTFLPNARVRLKYALCGGLTAGLLWELLSWIFASFIVGSTNYTAIYSGFAILILFMLWLYLGWLVVLVGGSVAFYLQHPEHLRPFRQISPPAPEQAERLALGCVLLVGSGFQSGRPPLSRENLSTDLDTPTELLDPVLDALSRAEILNRIQLCPDRAAFVPARPLEMIPIREVLRAIRRLHSAETRHSPILAEAEGIMKLWTTGAEDALGSMTLADLVRNSQKSPQN